MGVHGIFAATGGVTAPPRVLDFTGGVLAAGTTLTRASPGYRVRTGTNVVSANIATNNTPRFGRDDDAWALALVIEPTRTNILLQSDVSVAPWFTHSGAFTPNAAAAPDGTVTADRCTPASGNLGRLLQYVPTMVAGTKYTASAFALGVVGGESYQLAIFDSSVTYGRATATTLTLNWVRPSFLLQAGTNTNGDVSTCWMAANFGAAGNTGGIAGGVGVGARDGYVWQAQVEAGLYPTELMPTAGAAVTRAGEALAYTNGAELVSGGRLALEFVLRPKGAWTDQDGGVGYLWHDSASGAYARVNSDGAVEVFTGAGSVYVTPERLPGAARERCKVFVAVGGGAGTVVRAQDGAGNTSLLSLGVPTVQGNITVAGALDLLCAGAGPGQLGAWLESVTAYYGGAAPAWAAPQTATDWRYSGEGWRGTGLAERRLTGASEPYIVTHALAWTEYDTNADELDVDMYTTNYAAGAAEARTNLAVYDASGTVFLGWVNALTTANNAVTVARVALPGVLGSVRRVLHYNGVPRAAGATPAPNGTWLRQVTPVTPGSYARTRPVTLADRGTQGVVGYDDSVWVQIPDIISAGAVSARDTVAGRLRALCPNTRFVFVGYGGRGYSTDAGAALPAWAREMKAAATALGLPAASLQSWWQCSYNDFAAPVADATFSARVQAAIVAGRAALPGVLITLQTMGNTSLLVNGNGTTDTTWRTLVVNAEIAAGDALSTTYNGLLLYGAPDRADQVHLLDGTPGTAVAAANLKTAMALT
jgi:hypothetical protein